MDSLGGERVVGDSNSSILLKIERELARVGDLERREALRSLLVRPTQVRLDWDYGKPGQQFDCWLVGRSPDQSILLVYCEQGFGPLFPWGYVFAHTRSMGMDSDWHSGLADAAIVAGLISMPAGYVVPGPRSDEEVR